MPINIKRATHWLSESWPCRLPAALSAATSGGTAATSGSAATKCRALRVGIPGGSRSSGRPPDCGSMRWTRGPGGMELLRWMSESVGPACRAGASNERTINGHIDLGCLRAIAGVLEAEGEGQLECGDGIRRTSCSLGPRVRSFGPHPEQRAVHF